MGRNAQRRRDRATAPPANLTLDEWAVQIANRNPQVVIGYVRDEHVKGRTFDDVLDMVMYDMHEGSGFLNVPNARIALESGPRIAEARNQLVDIFMSHPEYQGATHLLMFDTDHVIPANTLEALVKCATRNDIAMLGALCFVGRPDGRQYPTIYRAYNEGDNNEYLAIEPVDEYPENELVKVGATGGGCILIRRDVFARMLTQFGRLANGQKNPYPWFQEGLTTMHGKALGEDIAFCRKAMLMGIDMYVHTGVKLGHIKYGNVCEESWLKWKAEQPKVPDDDSR